MEREIAQWVHPMKDRADDPSHHEQTLLLRSYISLPLSTVPCNKYPANGRQNVVVLICSKHAIIKVLNIIIGGFFFYI